MEKFSEVNEVIRWYPSEFKKLDSRKSGEKKE